MLILGLDTALQHCSVALVRDGEVLAAVSEGMARGHAERLAPMVGEVFRAAGVSMRALDRLGVVVGPGGFTGVRVGLAFARGAGVASGIDVVGVTSLEALAAGVDVKTVHTDEVIAPIVDARRGEVYGGVYRQDGASVLAPFVATPDIARDEIAAAVGAAPVLLTGSGAGLLAPISSGARIYRDHAGAELHHIDPVSIASLAAASSETGRPAPLYLRAPDAKPPKPSPLKAPDGS
ncbi:MAG: tRNA (adenosine(37)-N6)-threonylcarbamoyltransferase complex dimerization subunit type 1 TsaB [Pseudomonadota bacterium]